MKCLGFFCNCVLISLCGPNQVSFISVPWIFRHQRTEEGCYRSARSSTWESQNCIDFACRDYFRSISKTLDDCFCRRLVKTTTGISSKPSLAENRRGDPNFCESQVSWLNKSNRPSIWSIFRNKRYEAVYVAYQTLLQLLKHHRPL